MPALLHKISLLVCITLLLNACEGQKNYSEIKEIFYQDLYWFYKVIA